MLLWVASAEAVDFAYFLPGDFSVGFSVQHLGYLEWSPMTNIVQVEIHQPSATTSLALTGDCRAFFCWQSRSARHWATPGAVCNTRPGGRTGPGGIHHGMLGMSDTKGPPHDLRPSRIGHVPWMSELKSLLVRQWNRETYLRDVWWYRITKLHPLLWQINTGVNGLRQPQSMIPSWHSSSYQATAAMSPCAMSPCHAWLIQQTNPDHPIEVGSGAPCQIPLGMAIPKGSHFAWNWMYL